MTALVATLIDHTGAPNRFVVACCPIHVMLNGDLYAREFGGAWDRDSTYRLAGALVIDPARRIDDRKEAAHASR